MTSHRHVVALEARLKGCKNVTTLGARPNISDYSRREMSLIRDADKIYYPTTFYADLFDIMGKATFPSYHTYKCVQDKIKQTALFNMLGIPQPKTRVFYGPRQKRSILDYFKFPFIGKIPRGSARGAGVYLIKNRNDLEAYCNAVSPAYIQEFVAADRDIRAVVIGRKIVHAYWRVAPSGEFRSNVSLGATISLDPIPDKALELALYTARQSRWNDVGIDICRHDNGFCVLEANMKYGKEGFRAAGIDYKRLMEKLIENGDI